MSLLLIKVGTNKSTKATMKPPSRTVLSLIVFWCWKAAEGGWSGEYEDRVFGGSLFVCTTDMSSSGSTIAQGVFSQFGYMRGEVVGNRWEGMFYMAGLEARHGSFNLSLASSDELFSGNFVDSAGFSFHMEGNKLSSGVPKDTDCFKSDENLLTLEGSDSLYTLTSKALALNIDTNATQDRYAYSDANEAYISWTASFGIGFNYGTVFANGQVSCMQWYEGNSAEGIELVVGRDLDSYYSVWLLSPSVAFFNYTQIVLIDKSFGVEINSMSDKSTSADDALEYSFLRLLTSSSEDMCSGALDGKDSDCDDDISRETLAILVIVLIGVGCLNFFFVLYIGYFRYSGAHNSQPPEDKTTTISAIHRT